MIVLDTTVLVYAKGVEHPLRDPCRRLVVAIADGAVQATTTAEVIQELVHVRARRRGRDDAARLGDDYAELLTPLLAVSVDDLRSGLGLFRRLEPLGAFDAVLTATAVRADAEFLVSADRAFAAVGKPRYVFPDRDGIDSLLAEVAPGSDR